MARNYGRQMERIKLGSVGDPFKLGFDYPFIKRGFIRPCDRMAYLDFVETENRSFLVCKPIEETSKKTIDGGIGQRVFSNSVIAYKTQSSRQTIIYKYNGFFEEELIALVNTSKLKKSKKQLNELL